MSIAATLYHRLVFSVRESPTDTVMLVLMLHYQVSSDGFTRWCHSK